MRRSERELLGRVLSSLPFSRSLASRRILELLCERASAPGSAPLREQEIAALALGRGDDFDPRIDPIVRVQISSIRRRLGEYFQKQGQGEALRLTIPKGEYRAEFSPADRGPLTIRRDEGTSALEKFWQPHLRQTAPNLAVFSELLFYRDGKGNLLRNFYVNDPLTGPDEIRKRFSNLRLQTVAPCFDFISAGEMQCLYRISSLFSRLHSSLEFRNARFTRWHDLQGANLVLVGSARANPLLASLQDRGVFHLSERNICCRNPQPNEAEAYGFARRSDGNLHRLTEHVLVSRFRGRETDGYLTAVAANYGRAIEGAGRYITEERAVRGLIRKMVIDPENGELPSEFQLVLRVEMVDVEEEVIGTEYIAHRIIG